jgi:hypothetical protein
MTLFARRPRQLPTSLLPTALLPATLGDLDVAALAAVPILEAVHAVRGGRRARGGGSRTAMTMTAVAVTAAVATAGYLWWRRHEQQQDHSGFGARGGGVAMLLAAPPAAEGAPEVDAIEADATSDLVTDAPTDELAPEAALEVEDAALNEPPVAETEASADLEPFEAQLALMDVPEAELPEAELPEAALPEAELPVAELPEAELQELESPEAELPEAELPAAELPEAELPEAELPELETSEVPDAPAMTTPPALASIGAVAPRGPAGSIAATIMQRAEVASPASSPAPDTSQHATEAEAAARLTPRPSFQPLTTRPFTVPSPRPKLPGGWRNPMP